MTPADKKKLKAQAHPLKPVIIIGQAGLTPAVLNETELALDAHELIKVKIRAEREERMQIRDRLCSETGAELIQTIGQIVVIYRKNPDK
ncbi:ribosome assembly RNA-binding protein YhbY [Methylomarinum vadi]|uniref:ribosome assembly RNA-binding protein YhbY n=1 Tax=Methylomarinum vadi TaxID=438855 RepID=UPI0004DF234D|nr:ribosome assembly RNA-binding protein YhbY [Methylomarinum vadi]